MVSKRADDVLRSIEGRAWHRFLPIIGPRKGEFLIDLIRNLKPKRILEIGILIEYFTILKTGVYWRFPVIQREIEGVSGR